MQRKSTRIPDEEIERIRREASLVRLIQAEGIELRGSGDNLMGRCPFHEDGTPSLSVSPTKNLWHCHGACQEGGDVIAWVRKRHAASFRHAVELIRADYPSLVGEASGAGKHIRMLPPLVRSSTEEAEVLALVKAYYHETLKRSPEALAYLAEARGLRDPAMIDHFELGFSNRTLGYRLPPVGSVEGKAARERLKAAGILTAKGYELLNGSLVVPLLDPQGAVAGMYGRKIAPKGALHKDAPLHLYLPGPHRVVFNERGLGAEPSAILCEAILDALTFWCAGFRNVTASYGVSGFTPLHLEALKRHRIEQVLIAYDRDEAGDKAAEALAERLMGEGFECFRVLFPFGMDANEYALKVASPAEAFGELVRHAAWLGKGKRVAVDASPSSQAAAEPLQVPSSVPSLPPEAADLVVEAAPATKPSEPAAAPAAVPPPALAQERPMRPSSGGAAIEAELTGDEVRIAIGDRRYRARGLGKNLTYDQLKVNLLAGRGELFHVDTLDLYASKARAAFVKQAAFELKAGEDVLTHDLKHVLRKLEELQDQIIQKTTEPKEAPRVVLTPEREALAMELLRDPRLLDRILADFAACGVVGEEVNKLTGFLAAVSRLLEEPLAVIIQATSAAGKTALMDAVLAFMPEEGRVKYSAMTGQSLFYMSGTDLKHKILAIVEEAGAEKASYALKLLQSEGELTIASTGKDPHTGRLVTQEYRVEGPVMIFLTTTAVEVDEELLNRCLVLTVDEDRDQTRAIHRQQREKQTLEGLLARQTRSALLEVHQDAQRLLKPLLVANPFARHLTFLDDRTRTRRDHVKYLTLIRSIALLHQYQREMKTVEHRGEVVPYIEVSLEDIAVANRLAHQVLGRSLDELAPQSRRLLMLIEGMVEEATARESVPRSAYRFTRRQVRETTGWGNTQLKVHLARLEEMEYLIAHRGERGGNAYELVYDGGGKDGTPFLSGLLDVAVLPGRDGTRPAFSDERSALEAEWPAPGRGLAGPRPGGGRTAPLAISATTGPAILHAVGENGRNARLGSVSAGRPVTSVPVTSASPRGQAS